MVQGVPPKQEASFLGRIRTQAARHVVVKDDLTKQDPPGRMVPMFPIAPALHDRNSYYNNYNHTSGTRRMTTVREDLPTSTDERSSIADDHQGPVSVTSSSMSAVTGQSEVLRTYTHDVDVDEEEEEDDEEHGRDLATALGGAASYGSNLRGSRPTTSTTTTTNVLAGQKQYFHRRSSAPVSRSSHSSPLVIKPSRSDSFRPDGSYDPRRGPVLDDDDDRSATTESTVVPPPPVRTIEGGHISVTSKITISGEHSSQHNRRHHASQHLDDSANTSQRRRRKKHRRRPQQKQRCVIM